MSQHNRRGILTMTGAMVFFVVNDALVKWVSTDLSTPQLIFVRGVMTTALLLALAAWMGQLSLWRSALITRSVPTRALVDSLASFTYLTAVFHMPLGNATAINLAGPLFLTVLAVFFLHERVSLGRWALILLGFAGVLLVVQPRAGEFNAYAWLCLLAAMLHAGRDFLTRLVPAQVPSLLITLSTAIMVTLLAGVWSLFEPWRAMSATHIGQLFAAAMCLAAAYHLLTLSMRLGDMSVIGPFRYSGLLMALLLGYLMWGDVPNGLAWCGIALVVAAGLGLLQAERLRKQALLAME
ncbi:DMT family transporter [Limnohabitans sp.]|jgi:drug/metabolite transporter (DMT)-like permease|uniref:DMT family transporter n=1 Tax=Limnohabitans sp. TaxID=1907725 RepID=UPI0037C1B17C